MTTDSVAQPERKSSVSTAFLIGIAALIALAFFSRFAQQPSPMIGKPAPDFSLEVIGAGPGDRVRLSELKGKVVVLSFWASWCDACQLEAPSLDHLSRRLRDRDVIVIAIDTNDVPERALRFIRQKGLSLTFVHDSDGDVAGRYGIESLPTVLVIDKHGVVRSARTGPVSEGSLESLVSKAMQDGTGPS